MLLYVKELEGFLDASPINGSLNSFFVFSLLFYGLISIPLIGSYKISIKFPDESGPPPAYSVKQIWRIEMHDSTVGGHCTWHTQFRFKHLLSGTYLAGDTQINPPQKHALSLASVSGNIIRNALARVGGMILCTLMARCSLTTTL